MKTVTTGEVRIFMFIIASQAVPLVDSTMRIVLLLLMVLAIALILIGSVIAVWTLYRQRHTSLVSPDETYRG